MPVFLFTDLESSTRLWEEHPQEMRSALARHDQILQEAVASGPGRVVKTTGDGIMAVFSSVAAAVKACVDAQTAIAAYPWPTPRPLKVRMGIHTGEAEERAADYFGSTVNRAARIMAAAHGGQVLLSGVAVSVAGVVAGVEFRDLGLHRLKDLTEPERLYQLVHPKLEGSFPPPVTLDLRPHNLPFQFSDFLGREAELASIRELFDRPGVRLVTLTGPGGTGKTRLALQAAAELLDRYRDGVYFVDLSAERDADSAFEAVLRDLNLASIRQGSPLEVLKSELRDREMLLILDNFEQVTAAAVGVAELLQQCPFLHVVVTSREALRVRGEHVFPVPVLSLPDPEAPLDLIAGSEAVDLFIERARAVEPNFSLTDDNARAVAQIAVRLDGLPLALELAAARLGVFSPSELLARLRQHSIVLGEGPRDLPSRQRTLENTIDWSYELLDESECRVFELISVFSTTSLDAVEAVAREALPGAAVVEALGSLVAKSLVRSEDGGASRRFSMLRTIRDFAAERLAADPRWEAEARRAHARYFCAYASGLRQSLRGSQHEATLDQLSLEIGNLRSAWRFWVEVGGLEELYELLDGLWALSDARGWYHAAIELTRDLLEVLRATRPEEERTIEEMTLRSSLARALMAVRGYTPEVEQEFTRAMALSSVSDPAAQRFPILRAVATYYMNIGEFGRTADLGRQLLELARAENDDNMQVEGHLVYGLGLAFADSVDEGLAQIDRALELFDINRHGRSRFRLGTNPGVVALIASGLLKWQQGFPDQADSRVAEAVDIAKRIDHPYSLCYATYHAGFHDLNRGRLELVRQRAEQLSDLAGLHDYHVWKALGSVLLGTALCGLGDVGEGLAQTTRGLDLYSGLTTPPVFWPPLLSLMSQAYHLGGEPARALELIDEAITAIDGVETGFPDFRTLRGDILTGMGRRKEAEESYRTAIRGAGAAGLRLLELTARTHLVEFLRAAGIDYWEDQADLARLYEMFTEGWDGPELVAARQTLGYGSPANASERGVP
jgi:predicted ATPase/class 3 adenylate cyclase